MRKVLLLLFAFCLLQFGYAQTSQIEIPVKNQTSSKMRQSLYMLESEYNNYLREGGEKNAFVSVQDLILIDNGMVRIEATAKERPALLLLELEVQGAYGFDSYRRLVNAWYPINKISELELMSELQFVKPVYRVGGDIGAATSEGDVALQAAQARIDYCLDGTGVRVGVISDSYTSAFPGGAAAGVASGDIPGVGNPNGFTSPVTVVNEGPPGIDEGRAMIEIVHDLAPGAQIFFNTSSGGQATYANAINNLASVSNCDIIVDDVRYFEEPFYMDGLIAQACDNVFANGVPYFASAGNYAQSSYEAPYNSTTSGSIPGSSTHDFDPGPGIDDLQLITVNAGSRINLTLQWDDPWGSITPNGAATNLDVFLFTTGGTLVAQATDNNIGNDPTEFFSYTAPGGVGTFSYNILIRRISGPSPSIIKWVIRNANGLVINEYPPTTVNAQGTGYGHSNAAGANAVGAAFWGNTPAYGQTPPLPEGFTSNGGVQIRYNTNGVAITPFTRLKPNFTAADGTSNTFFGNGNNFFGTSAAAPHAAAVAALMLEANASLTPTQVRNVLVNSSIDMLTPGFDYTTGSGLIQADVALQSVFSAQCNISNITVQIPPACYAPGLYNVTVRVSYSQPPGCNDQLSVNGQTFTATGASFEDVTLTGLPANGSAVGVTAFFVSAPGCNLTVSNLFTAPETPGVACPADIVVGNDAGVCGAIVNFTATNTGDPGATITYSQDPGTFFPVGTTQVDVTSTSACGVANCSFNVTVNDVEAPIVNTKPAFVILSNGTASITADDVDNVSTDNCGIDSKSVSPNFFTCDDIGTVNVNLTVTDINGLSANAPSTVEVIGEIPSCSIISVPTSNIYTGGVPTTLYLGYGAQSTILEATASGGATFDYSWTNVGGLLDDPTVSNPEFTPLVEGTYTYTLTVTNNYGCTNTCEITIEVIDVRCGKKNDKVLVCHNGNTICVSPNAVPAHLSKHPSDYLGDCTSKNGVTGNMPFKAYPNPSTGLVNLDIEVLNDATIQIEVFNALGQIVYAENIQEREGHFVHSIDISSVSSGMYFIKVMNDGVAEMQRIQIQK